MVVKKKTEKRADSIEVRNAALAPYNQSVAGTSLKTNTTGGSQFNISTKEPNAEGTFGKDVTEKEYKSFIENRKILNAGGRDVGAEMQNQKIKEEVSTMEQPELEKKLGINPTEQTDAVLNQQNNQQIVDQINNDFETQVRVQHPNLPEGTYKTMAMLNKSAEGALPKALSLGAQLIDAVRVAINGKKPLKVQQAEGTLTDSMTILKNNLESVKAGTMNPLDLKVDIQKVRNSISRLQETQKGIGKANSRYWSDEGVEIEEEIELKNGELEDIEKQLIILMGGVI